MADYSFERESRTPCSEAYTIEEGVDEVGRVDLHFTLAGTVYGTLCVIDGFEDESLQDLIGEIDEHLVLTSDPYREDFVVTVWGGRRMGVYSEEEEEDDVLDGDENGNAPA